MLSVPRPGLLSIAPEPKSEDARTTTQRDAQSSRPRVVYVSLEWPTEEDHAGGVGRYTERLARAVRSDVDLSVVSASGGRRMPGVDLVAIPETRFGRFGRYYIAPFSAARAVRRLRPDVVHSHGDDFALLWRQPAPIVRTFYGASMNEAVRGRGRLLRRANHLLLGVIESLSASRYAVTVGIGPDSVAAHDAEHLIPPVFLRGPQSTGGDERKDDERRDRERVVFIGTFESKKRGALALRVVEEARRKVPNLQFVVVGPPSDRARYPAWVTFESELTDREVLELLACSGVLLAPSSYEGFGIHLWEALSVGTLVVSTPNPGASYIAQGMACSIVRPEALAAEVARLVTLSGAQEAEHRTEARMRAKELSDEGDPWRYVRLYRDLSKNRL